MNDNNESNIQNGWNKWALFVINELKRLDNADKEVIKKIEDSYKDIRKDIKESITELKDELIEKQKEAKTENHQSADKIEYRLKEIEKDLTHLKIKAGKWGAIAGIIASAIPIIISIILHFTDKI